jgi:hypothetical protein
VLEQGGGMAHGKAKVGQAALVATPGGVPDDYGQNVQAEMVVVRPPHRAADQKPAVAAAQVQDKRSLPAKDLLSVKPPIGGKIFKGCLRPLGRIEDFSRNGNPKFPFDAARLFHDQ